MRRGSLGGSPILAVWPSAAQRSESSRQGRQDAWGLVGWLGRVGVAVASCVASSGRLFWGGGPTGPLTDRPGELGVSHMSGANVEGLSCMYQFIFCSGWVFCARATVFARFYRKIFGAICNCKKRYSVPAVVSRKPENCPPLSPHPQVFPRPVVSAASVLRGMTAPASHTLGLPEKKRALYGCF